MSHYQLQRLKTNGFGAGTYYGEVVAGPEQKRHGRGLMTYECESRYYGEWQNDKYGGCGIYRFKNGDCFDGEWINGEINGSGTFRFADGRVFSGEWVNHKPAGDSAALDTDGRLWSAECDGTTYVWDLWLPDQVPSSWTDVGVLIVVGRPPVEEPGGEWDGIWFNQGEFVEGCLRGLFPARGARRVWRAMDYYENQALAPLQVQLEMSSTVRKRPIIHNATH